jgi:hypothetical protein
MRKTGNLFLSDWLPVPEVKPQRLTILQGIKAGIKKGYFWIK